VNHTWMDLTRTLFEAQSQDVSVRNAAEQQLKNWESSDTLVWNSAVCVASTLMTHVHLHFLWHLRRD